jgi:hypothetical protein
MAHFAKSQDSKQRTKRAATVERYHCAVTRFHELEAQGLKPKVRQVTMMEDVDHTTLGHHLKGKRTMDDFNTTKTKLSDQQEAVLVEWIIELTDRNLGLVAAVIYDRTSQLYQSTHPKEKLGVSWTGWFICCHHDKLACHWSRPLDNIRKVDKTGKSEILNGHGNLQGPHHSIIQTCV